MWVNRWGLPEDLKGKAVMMDDLGDLIPGDPYQRKLIVRAMARILKRRGARIEFRHKAAAAAS